MLPICVAINEVTAATDWRLTKLLAALAASNSKSLLEGIHIINKHHLALLRELVQSQ